MKIFYMPITMMVLACGQLKPGQGSDNPSSNKKKSAIESETKLEEGSIQFEKLLSISLKYLKKTKKVLTTHEDVKPIFDRDCKGCHFGAVMDFKEFPYKSKDMNLNDLIATSLQRMRREDLKRMPPVNKPKTPSEDIALVQRWFDGGLKTIADLPPRERVSDFSLKVFYRSSQEREWENLSVDRETPVRWVVRLNMAEDDAPDLLLEISDLDGQVRKIMMAQVSAEMSHIEIEW